jgi:hypothetical protein
VKRRTLLLLSPLVSPLVGACAGAPPPAATPKQVSATHDAGAEAGAPPSARVASLEELAARGPNDAPGMREQRRVADASTPVEIRAPAESDVCVRAVYAASRPVRAWIEDDSKTPHGDVAPEATSGLVPPRGPACARKGELLRLVIDRGEGPIVARAVIWQAP